MLRLQHVMFTLLLKNNSGAGGGCCWQPGPRSKSIPTAVPPVIVGTIYINRSPRHTAPTYYLILIEIDDLTYQDERDEPYNTSKDFTLVFLKKNEVLLLLQMERERES